LIQAGVITTIIGATATLFSFFPFSKLNPPLQLDNDVKILNNTCDKGYNYIYGTINDKTSKNSLVFDNFKLIFEAENDKCKGIISSENITENIFRKKTKNCSKNEEVYFSLDRKNTLYKLGMRYSSTICSDHIMINIYDK
jgi:hypothetical protein